MIRAVSALACAAALAACGSKPPPRPPVPKAPAAPAAAAAGAPDSGTGAAQTSEWVYSSVGKRDPFRSFIDELEASRGGGVAPCKTPLGRFELEQLRLVAVVTGLADPVAMVEAPNGVGYALRRGACLGKNGGVVAAIRSGEVVVAEWAVKADGSRDRTRTILKLPKEAALNLEE